ncbi:MAG: acetoacetate decarboxylase family protein [Acidimicrobiia bacterium]
MPRVLHPTGMFLADHFVFGVFEPADRDTYVDLIPPPFSPSPSPQVYVYVVSFDEVSPWPLTPYREASVLISVQHGRMEGWYPLMMPVTGRVALLGGRRRGFPKEMAAVSLSEDGQGWVGSAVQDNRLLLRVEVNRAREIGDDFDDPGTPYSGVPILNLVPPLVGPKVVMTTVETLVPPAVTRYAGVMTTGADPGYPWSPLLQSGSVGYFEKSSGARVLRHGRVAARFTTNGNS